MVAIVPFSDLPIELVEIHMSSLCICDTTTGFTRALVVPSPTSLGAVRGGVARLPCVALGTVSGRILRVVTCIVCLWNLVLLGDIASKTEHLVVICVSTFIEIR